MNAGNNLSINEITRTEDEFFKLLERWSAIRFSNITMHEFKAIHSQQVFELYATQEQAGGSQLFIARSGDRIRSERLLVLYEQCLVQWNTRGTRRRQH